jgi:hypothetical protein
MLWRRLRVLLGKLYMNNLLLLLRVHLLLPIHTMLVVIMTKMLLMLILRM